MLKLSSTLQKFVLYSSIDKGVHRSCKHMCTFDLMFVMVSKPLKSVHSGLLYTKENHHTLLADQLGLKVQKYSTLR